MSVHIVYRASPGPGKNRPDGFSKARCLLTFLRAFEQLDQASVTFVVDGDIPGDALATMAVFGSVERLSGAGNCGSYLRALDVGLSLQPRKSYLYFCEDDYLHTADALTGFAAALAEADPSTYLTLYDHPDRYRRTDDLVVPGRQIEMLGGRHWRVVESSAMTFGSTAETIRRDVAILRLAARFTRYPHDRTMWRTLQGLGARRPVRWFRGRRRLLSPVPALATHVEAGMMSIAVPWTETSLEADTWADERGLQLRRDW